jgi:hypothetical protein
MITFIGQGCQGWGIFRGGVMRCPACQSTSTRESPDGTAQGYRRFRRDGGTTRCAALIAVVSTITLLGTATHGVVAQPNTYWLGTVQKYQQTGVAPSGGFPSPPPADIVDLQRRDRELLQTAEKNVRKEEEVGERSKRFGDALPVAGAPEGADMLLKGTQTLLLNGFRQMQGLPAWEEADAQLHAAYVNNEVIKLERARRRDQALADYSRSYQSPPAVQNLPRQPTQPAPVRIPVTVYRIPSPAPSQNLPECARLAKPSDPGQC